MILVHRTGPLSTSILVGINNEYSSRFHVFRVTTTNHLILRKSRSARISLIISKLIALNLLLLLLLLLLIARIHPNLGQYSLSRLGTHWTLTGCKVGRMIDEGIGAEDPL